MIVVAECPLWIAPGKHCGQTADVRGIAISGAGTAALIFKLDESRHLPGARVGSFLERCGVALGQRGILAVELQFELYQCALFVRQDSRKMRPATGSVHRYFAFGSTAARSRSDASNLMATLSEST